MLIFLLQGAAYGFAAAVTPGPLTMFIISEAIRSGWRRTIPAAFAPLISDGPISILVLTILNQTPPRAFAYLRLLGGIFLLYLAYRSWKAWKDFDSRKADAIEPGRRSPLKAAVINWLNPNPYIGWSFVLGPILINGWRASPANGIALLAGFYAVIISSMAAMILLFATARRLGNRVQKAMIAISSVALACFGIYQLWLSF
jgi:threonine/homoserine/homoserine lactone efflux protein